MMKCAMMAFATLAVAAAGAGDLRLVAGGAALLEFGRVAGTYIILR